MCCWGGAMAASSKKSSVRLTLEPPSAVPYPDLTEDQKLSIEAAVGEAWKRLLVRAKSNGTNLYAEPETNITLMLREELDKLRLDEREPIPGFSQVYFGHITESERTPNASGIHTSSDLELPDLVFRPVRTPRNAQTWRFGLFVECKIINCKQKGHKEWNYCYEGLKRFITGAYASAMPSGMMIAYVRDGTDIPGTLTPYLGKQAQHQKLEVCQLPALRQGANSRPPDAYISIHGRAQVNFGGVNVGDIKIAHLWLNVA